MRKRKKGDDKQDVLPVSNSKAKKQKGSSAKGTTSTSTSTSTKKVTRQTKGNMKKQAEMDEAETRLLLDPYRKMGVFCNPSNHEKNKKNCEYNPNCLYGFVNNKSGVWGPASTLFHSLLGTDPEAEKRDPNTPCGLVNLGATCYVNSLLQVLFFDGIFREALYSWKPRVECSMKNVEEGSGQFQSTHGLTLLQQEIIELMQNTFAHMQYGRTKSFNPRDFVSKLNLSTGIQQDGIEFNKLLLAMLEQIFCHASMRKLNTFIQDRYGGELCYCTKCLECKNVSKRTAPFYELELQIENCSTVKESLELYFKREKLNGDNKYNCEMQCNKKCDAERYSEICKLPKVINLQLMRFVFDMVTFRKKKVKAAISIPSTLTPKDFFGDDVRAETNGDGHIIYDLVAVLYHRGSSADSGHYVADVKALDGTWWNCNDQLIEKKQFQKVCSKSKKRKKPSQENTAQGDNSSSAILLDDVDSTMKVNDGNAQLLKDDSFFGNPSQNAYMLVYRQRGEYEGPFLTKEKISDTNFFKSVEKVNAELEKNISRYSQEKEKLSMEITNRINNYKDSFENADSKSPPYVLPEENANNVDSRFVWVPTKWLRNFIIGRDMIATSKGTKGTVGSTNKGVSNESIDNTIIDLASDGEKHCDDSDGKCGNKSNATERRELYDEPPDFSAVTCSHSTKDDICFGPKLAPKLKLVRKSNLSTLIKECKHVKLELFNCKECKVCRKEFIENFTKKSKSLNQFSKIKKLIEEDKLRISKERSIFPLLSKEWIKRLKNQVKSLESYRKDAIFGKFSNAPKKSFIDHFVNNKTSSPSEALPRNNPLNGLDKREDVNMEQQKIHMKDLDPIREFESTVVNTSVLCEHKSLVHNFSTKTQKISEETWKAIEKVFKNSPIRITSKSVCAICKGASDEQKSCTKEKKKAWSDRVALFTRDTHLGKLCRRHKNKMHPDRSKRLNKSMGTLLPLDPGVYRILNRNWLNEWRNFCKSVKKAEPKPLNVFPCRCTCKEQGTLVPTLFQQWLNAADEKSYFKYIDDMPASTVTEFTRGIEVVTDDQWNKLRIYYGYHGQDIGNTATVKEKLQDKYAFEPVSFSILPEGEAAIFNPPICQKCMISQLSNEEHDKIVFANKPIDVIKLKKDAKIEDVIAAKEKPNHQIGTTKRRRTRRAGALGTTKSIITSSSDKIALLKMKLLEHFTSIDDTNLGLMILYKGSLKLDNESTLRECKVRLGDTLFLRVLDDSDDPGKYNDYKPS